MTDENEQHDAAQKPFVDTFALFAGGCGAFASRLVVHPSKSLFI